MASARYEFRTSNINWMNGVLLLVVAAFTVGVWLARRESGTRFPVWVAAPVALSLPCFLARYSLMLDVTQGHVKDSSGFWPFARTRFEWVADFSGLEIRLHADGRSGHYTLWLIAKDGRRISLGDWNTWSRLNDRATELSKVTGWPVTDLTNGRFSIAALL